MKSRPVFGVLLIVLAFYAIYLYDTGRWNLIKAAITGAPGTPGLPLNTPLGTGGGAGPSPPALVGLTAPGSQSSVLPPGAHPQDNRTAPSLPSSANQPGAYKSSWLSAGQAIIAQLWPSVAPSQAPATPVPVSGSLTTPQFTTGINGAWA